MLAGITMSFDKRRRSSEASPPGDVLDKLDPEALSRIQARQRPARADPEAAVLERNFSYPAERARPHGRAPDRLLLGDVRPHARTGIVGAIGPGADLFRGYQDNTDFASILHRLLEQK